ncbi:hypothetical protein TNCV_5097051 [Trichonephila clavipes]|nr:hypothetical protein TNCV_5097051 [Trichonephila clavipes]
MYGVPLTMPIEGSLPGTPEFPMNGDYSLQMSMRFRIAHQTESGESGKPQSVKSTRPHSLSLIAVFSFGEHPALVVVQAFTSSTLYRFSATDPLP